MIKYETCVYKMAEAKNFKNLKNINNRLNLPLSSL